MTEAEKVTVSPLLQAQYPVPFVTEVSASPSPHTFVSKYLNMNLGKVESMSNLLPLKPNHYSKL